MLQEMWKMLFLSLVNLENLVKRERRGNKENQEKWVQEDYLVNKALRDHPDYPVQKVTLDLQER